MGTIPVWNVKDYGALGDGSTVDTLAVQACIDAAHTAGGGIVHVPFGTYPVGALTLYGDLDYDFARGAVLKLPDGASATLPVVGGVRAWVLANGQTNLHIQGLQLDGNAANNATLYSGLVFIQCARVTVQRLLAHDAYGMALGFYSCSDLDVSSFDGHSLTGGDTNPGEGIYVQSCQRVNLTNIRGKDIADHLIYVTGSGVSPCTDISIADAQAVAAGNAGTQSAAFKVSGNCQRISLSDCRSYDSGFGFTIVSNPDGSVWPVEVICDNCHAIDSVQYGGFTFQVVNTAQDIKATLNNCSSTGSAAAADHAPHGFTLDKVKGVTLSNCRATDNGGHGLYAVGCSHIKIEGGNYTDNSKLGAGAYHGIKIGSSTGGDDCDEVSITGVRATDTAAAGSKYQYAGIYVGGASTNVKVTGGCDLRDNRDKEYFFEAAVAASCEYVDIANVPLSLTLGDDEQGIPIRTTGIMRGTAGILFITCSDNTVAIFHLGGSNGGTAEISDTSGHYANTDIDGKHCVYCPGGTQYYLKNRRGYPATYHLYFMPF